MRRLICCLVATFATLLAHADNDVTNELILVERWLAAQRAYERVPGLAAAIVRDGEIIWSGASGYADLESRRPATPDTIFGICSISKVFTGIAAMQLRDQGRFRLDDPVAGVLPWFDLEQAFAGSPSITVEGLLTHSAGLPRESDRPYWVGPDFAFPSRAEVREILSGQQTIYPSQRYYQYSNLGLTLIGEIVAELSGQDFESYVDEHILAPLRLDDTATGFPDDDRESRVATGYGYPGRARDPARMPRYDTRGITPAAGFASTALDLARFAAWQFRVLAGETDKVLGGNTLREMQRVHWLDHDWSNSRGLAFGVYRIGDRTLVGHGGDCPGFNTRLYLDPVSKHAVIVMANRNNTPVDALAAKVFDILEAGGSASDHDDSASVPGVDLDEYVGSYDIRPWGGEDLVFRWQGGLAVTTLPAADPLAYMGKLRHIEGDRFRLIRSDDSDGHDIVFGRDAAGRVASITYHSVIWPKMEER